MGTAVNACCGDVFTEQSIDTEIKYNHNEQKNEELPIIAVLGATGAQGGAVSRALSESGLYKIRGLSRNPQSEKAKLLIAKYKNLTMIQADLNDIDSLKNAFDGVYGVFGVTFSWNHLDPAKECQEIKNLVQAAKECKVSHFIWSTLEDTRILIQETNKNDQFPTLHGKYKVPHLDVKGESDKLFKESGIPTTFVLSTFYWANFIGPMGPQNSDKNEGEFVITVPMGNKLVGMNLNTLGITVSNIFKQGLDSIESMVGRYIGVCDDVLSLEEICQKMSKKLGKTITFNFVEAAVYAQFGFPKAADLANMFKYYDVFSEHYAQIRDYGKLREICPELPKELNGFDVFLQEMGDKIPFPTK